MTNAIGEGEGRPEMAENRPSPDEWMRIERAQVELAETELVHIVLTRYIKSAVQQILVGVGRTPVWARRTEGLGRG